MEHLYNFHIFDVTDLCVAGARKPIGVLAFEEALVRLAERMTDLLPEYEVEAINLPGFSKLKFTHVTKPPMTPEDKDKVAWDALHYANCKAVDATRDMPRGDEKILAFAKAWREAILEYLEEHK